jgi:cyclopropane-fatty-acyl-phospholipid synthase
MDRSHKRLEALRRLLAHIRERLSFDVGFRLWDGSTVPPELGSSELAIAIADEGVIAALVRRPNVNTLINLWVSGRLDISGGTIFDLVARRPKVSSKATLKALDKRLVLSTAAKFLLVPRGGPWPLEKVRGDKARADGSEAANRANVQYHYDVSNAFYALFLDPEMVYTCAYFTEPEHDIATAQRAKLDMICRKLRLAPGETLLDIGCGWGGPTRLPLRATLICVSRLAESLLRKGGRYAALYRLQFRDGKAAPSEDTHVQPVGIGVSSR